MVKNENESNITLIFNVIAERQSLTLIECVGCRCSLKKESACLREFLWPSLILKHTQGWELITKPECLVIRRPALCFTGTTSSVKGLSELLRYTNFVSSVLAHSTESLHERYKSALYLLRGKAQTSTNERKQASQREWWWLSHDLLNECTTGSTFGYCLPQKMLPLERYYLYILVSDDSFIIEREKETKCFYL